EKTGALLAWACLGLGALALAASALLFTYVYTTSRQLGAERPPIRLVDPASGIASGADGHVRVSVSSDPHWGAPGSDAAARSAILEGIAAARPRKDALLILGDNVELGMEDGPWREELTELSAALPDTPVLSLMGNHDALINGQFHYAAYFGAAATDTGEPYYWSMDLGPARLIVLELLWGDESFGRRQEAWLERALASLPPGRQVIAVSHSFIYGSGYVDPETGMAWYDSPGPITRVAPILERHRVALLVSGHNHYMELLEHGPTVYAVIGAMGGQSDPEPSHVSPQSRWLRRGAFGRLDLDIGPDGIALAFVDSGGAVLHRAFIPARP
ncbi:MAG TPA: metallophosphoesterase, partial [Rectinemataceae bacterium]|nr:metallophosphoesterase [Rectinemataceae bacterium]